MIFSCQNVQILQILETFCLVFCIWMNHYLPWKYWWIFSYPVLNTKNKVSVNIFGIKPVTFWVNILMNIAHCIYKRYVTFGFYESCTRMLVSVYSYITNTGSYFSFFKCNNLIGEHLLILIYIYPFICEVKHLFMSFFPLYF